MVYRSLKGTAKPRAVLNLASRRGDSSEVVGKFLHLCEESGQGLSPKLKEQVTPEMLQVGERTADVRVGNFVKFYEFFA